MKIPLQAPDLGSILPMGLATTSSGDNPTSDGLQLHGLDQTQHDAIPDEGRATIHYKVHHRKSEEKIDRDGQKHSHHSVRMHVTGFEPHTKETAMPNAKEGRHESYDEEEDKKEKKERPRRKLTESRDAQRAVKEYLSPNA